MKRIAIFAAMALATTLAALNTTAQTAAETQPVTSRVTAATVFLRGAELTQTANLTLAKGANEITVEGLSPSVDQNSIRVNIGGGVVVSSHEFATDFLSTAQAPSAKIRMLQDSMRIYNDAIARTDVDIRINTSAQTLLDNGISKNVSGSEAGLGLDELKRTMDYHRAKSGELLSEAGRLAKRKEELATALERVQKQFNEERGEGGKTSGVLRLNLSAPAAGTFTATITYFTPRASWSPYYDVSVASTDRPVVFAARSRVSQNTGLDWENVRLTLSTSTPSNGRVAPLFSTWFLRQRPTFLPAVRAEAAMQNSISYSGDITVWGVVTNESGSPIVGVLVSSPAGTAITNETGAYSLDAISQGQLSFSYLGYKSLSVPVNGRTTINATMEQDLQALEEVVVVGYGTQRKVAITGAASTEAAPAPAIYDHVESVDNTMSVTYNIDLPYTIPGNGKERNIDLERKEAAAEYKFYCAPRLDGATYLLAEIANPEALGLLSAPANITYDGTYIGQTWIDASDTEEKLALTLGTDKRVSVTRELMKQFSSTKTLGGNTEQTFTWRITVRNNQTRPVEMVLKDQYPTSTDRAVTVTLDTKVTTPPTANVAETGVVTWEGPLAAGEVRVYDFSYTVKYPREMRLDL
jgi:hypothetical protein